MENSAERNSILQVQEEKFTPGILCENYPVSREALIYFIPDGKHCGVYQKDAVEDPLLS